MSQMHKDVILEALSALTGVTLKHHTDVREMGLTKELNIYNFVSIAVTGKRLMSKYSLHSAQTTHPSVQACDDFNGGSQNELFMDMDEFLDPEYDCDYTHLQDDSACSRGNEEYIRPIGWYRIALKVIDKYPDGNEWLGTAGWRSHSVDGEWPVSYHGTTIEGAKSIATSHYVPGDGKLYRRGIYSTPKIEEAASYSSKFVSKKDGKAYKILMQNRINPEERIVCKDKDDYWLIEIPKGTSTAQEKEIVEKSIRPYGILIKQMTESDDDNDDDGDDNDDDEDDNDDDGDDDDDDDGDNDDDDNDDDDGDNTFILFYE